LKKLDIKLESTSVRASLRPDIQAALNYQIPSDAAVQQAFEPLKKQRRPATQIISRSSIATAMKRQHICLE